MIRTPLFAVSVILKFPFSSLETPLPLPRATMDAPAIGLPVALSMIFPETGNAALCRTPEGLPVLASACILARNTSITVNVTAMWHFKMFF